MAVSKTALVLVQLIACSLAWENLPVIPANRRAEYYLQHDDGAYKFGYDTGAGQSAVATADASNQVKGQYSYVDETGQRVNWEYTAGDGGFVPFMRGSSSRTPAGVVAAKSTASFGSRAHSVPTGVVPAASPYTGASTGSADPNYDANADASYNFKIDTDSYKRTESADSRGNVQGQYSYNSPVGGSHAVSYIAGEGTGFVVTGSDSSAPGGKQAYSAKPAASSGYSYKAPAQTYIPPATPYSGPLSNGQSQVNPDGSFAFSYSTPDHSHQAIADANNNVRGSYSFTSKDDGKTRKVDYQAGAATGYVASGAHLPVAPAVPSAVKSYSSGAQQGYYGAASQGSSSFGNFGGQKSSGEPSNAQSVINPDGSFAYSYSTGDQSSQVTADAQNNVRGSFSFKSKDDGKTRKVDYIAGASSGFVASGDHLPVAPSPASGATSYSAPKTSYLAPKTTYTAPKTSAFGQTSGIGGASSYVAPTVNNAQSDGSYSFSYQTDDHSHHATSDAQNNVRGSFSFKAKDDGKTRKVDYIAGASTGFVASGDHLPVAPSPAAGASSYSAPKTTYSAPKTTYSAPKTTTFGQSAGSRFGSSAGTSTINNGQSDGSYSFSYQTNDHSHHAASDPSGNVQGSFSFVADDGVNRKVDYTAGANKGFVAKGAHLPVAPAPSSGISTLSSGSGSYNKAASSGSTSGGYQYKAPSTTYLAPSSGSYSSGSNNNNDGSYSYSYDAGTSSKQESADAQGNVAGSFSFLGGDGVNRKLTYTARAEEGFIAKGDHLPVAPAGTPTQQVGLSAQNAFAHPGLFASAVVTNAASGVYGSSNGQVKAAKDGAYSYSYTTGGQGAAGSGATPYSNKPSSSSFGSGAGKPYSSSSSVGAAGSRIGSQQNDGSYSFSYDAGTHSHQQSADAQNNVRGSYSFKAKDDGQVRKVDYTAGAATGFVAQGAHLPVAPSGSQGASAYIGGRPSHSPGIKAPGQRIPAHGGGNVLASPKASAYDASANDNGDGSYSYSYKTDTSSKTESADAQGNVVGSFSYIGGDGVNRKLSYTAKNEAGFLASGAHLPVAPSLGSSSHFGTKSSSALSHSSYQSQTGGSAAQVTGHSLPASTSHLHAHAHAHGHETRDGNVVISKYLPPDSAHKFGYIFDTKA